METSKCQKRGKSKVMFSDSPINVKMATSIGVKALRFDKGLTEESYHFRHLSEVDHRILVDFVAAFESAKDDFLLRHCVRDMNEARKVVDWPTFGGKAIAVQGLNATKNASYEVHADSGDFGLSAAMVLKEGHTCALNDEVVSHFCFLRLGLAVPLRPGDVIVFNSHKPHCLSSRSNKNDDIIGLSIYVKTKICGLNNEKIPLTKEQVYLSNEYKKRQLGISK